MATTKVVNFSGAVEPFVVPNGVTSIVTDVRGGQGAGNDDGDLGGAGGRARGTLAVSPGQVLYLNVGQWGVNGTYGGGGNGGAGGAFAGGDGGGASDIRVGSNSLDSRVIVAGGGGGAGYSSNGGVGGGNPAGDGQGGVAGEGGSGSGGAGGSAGGGATDGTAGSAGQGGNGGNAEPDYGGGGGGGGGYFGGGGGGGAHFEGGGGGGSGYTGGAGLTATSMTNGFNNGNGSIRLTYTLKPNAPVVTAPTEDQYWDVAVINRVTWDFSHPDPLAVQKSFKLRYRIVGTSTWTDVAATTANHFWDAAANLLPTGELELQVDTTDTDNQEGPYCSSVFFNVAAVPDPPTITTPTLDSNVGPIVPVAWTGSGQTIYEARRVADNGSGSPDTGTVYEDTDPVISTEQDTSLLCTVNNRVEHVQVRISNGLWSAWASVRVNVDFAFPPAPVVDLAEVPEDGAIDVSWSTPAPSGDEIAVSSTEVWVMDDDTWERRKTLTAADTSWRYWEPRSAPVDYLTRIKVVNVAANGGSTEGFPT